MQHADKVVHEVQHATQDVFGTMLGISLQAGEALVTREEPAAKDGILSFIGFAGDWVGTGSIACNSQLACEIANAFLMTEKAAVDDEVLDAIAELTNMIIGNLKTALEQEFGVMALSIPTVIYGRNFMTRTTGQNEWVLVPFQTDHGAFEVHVCLMPNVEHHRRVGKATIHLPHAVPV